MNSWRHSLTLDGSKLNNSKQILVDFRFADLCVFVVIYMRVNFVRRQWLRVFYHCSTVGFNSYDMQQRWICFERPGVKCSIHQQIGSIDLCWALLVSLWPRSGGFHSSYYYSLPAQHSACSGIRHSGALCILVSSKETQERERARCSNNCDYIMRSLTHIQWGHDIYWFFSSIFIKPKPDFIFHQQLTHIGSQ